MYGHAEGGAALHVTASPPVSQRGRSAMSWRAVHPGCLYADRTGQGGQGASSDWREHDVCER
jgi:hypothetical protein